MLRRVFSFTFSLLLQLYAVSYGFCVCLTMPSNQTRIKITKLHPIISLAFALLLTLLISNYTKVQVSILLFDFYFQATIIETSQPASPASRKSNAKNGHFLLYSRDHPSHHSFQVLKHVYTFKRNAKKRANG